MSWFDDNYDPGPDEWEDCEDGYAAPRVKPTCERCGKANLTWGQTLKGWRLYEGYERPHVCGPKPATPNDFEEVK